VALLIKQSCLRQQELLNAYIHPLNAAGIPSQKIIAFSLQYQTNNKAPAKLQKEYLGHLLPALDRLGVTMLYCCDAHYFKTLTKVSKAEGNYGYVLPCKVKGFEHMQVILGMNHQALLYNPELQSRLDLSLKTLADYLHGTYVAIGQGIIHSASYPDNLDDIELALENLHLYSELATDIEAFSLRFHEAGIATISFAWDQHNGIAFAVDYRPKAEPEDGAHGEAIPDRHIRYLLKKFFETYEGKLVWHGSTYDLRVLIYQLWMLHPLDTAGLLKGLEVMTRSFDDTKIITYLATNSTAGNTLGLKYQAHEFAGNWAQEEIQNVLRIPLPQLLQYNLIDALSTHYVREKHWPTLVQDQQLELYETLFKPSLKTIIQMELTGMPLNPAKVQAVKATLQAKQEECLQTIMGHPVIAHLNQVLQQRAMEKANAKLKLKQHPIEHFAAETFNPNSGPQLQVLLYELMQLPVIDLTDTRQPATGADTLEKLVNHTVHDDYKSVLEALISYGKVTKILSAFIPAFEEALAKGDGIAYLHGCFTLGGTVSGRLSSSDPNMQNLPVKKPWGPLIKECFQAPPGWLFVGADFSSLEDRINALLTKDPNKLKVYTDGYDGHCLRAYSYYDDQMPDIVDTVESINSIETRYPALRQDSKAPTFALTFQGTWRTLTNTLGWSEEKAKRVEAKYLELYAASTAWVKARIEEACQVGYAEGAFGLRIRTPLLKQSILGTQKTPREAEAEARTLGNAISGQSYGLLTNRAANAFMERVWDSPHREKIKPIAMIHDAIYLLIADEPDVVLWVNENLIEEMEWQDLPEIQHPQVKLGAELDIFWPTWANKVTIPNHCTRTKLVFLVQKHMAKLSN
jgi:DNA polymerase-1